MSGVRLEALGADADPNAVGLKARSLGRAFSLGLRVPDGFVIGPDDATLEEGIRELEEITATKLGDPLRPLVLSVRASSPKSMPGQLDTVLCFGASEASLPALTGRLGSRRAALEAAYQVRRDAAYLRGEPLPRTRPKTAQELEAALPTLPDVPPTLAALLDLIERIRSRAQKKLVERLPIIVQAMVFGSAQGTSGALVAHSRHPVSGEPGPRGEWTTGMLGDQLTGGRTTPSPIAAIESPRAKDASLELRAPGAFAEVGRVVRTLERSWRAPVEVEMALENGALHVLQVRPATLGPVAQVTAAVALVNDGVIDRDEAFLRIDVETLRRAGKTELPDPETLRAAGVSELGRGLVASPGVASGRLYIRPEDVLASSDPAVLVRSDASPEDAAAVRAAVGVATASGGLTSHAAVMSRALGRPCAVSVSNLAIDERGGQVSASVPGKPPTSVKVGEWVTVDGTDGRLLLGRVAARWATRSPAAQALIAWANEAGGTTEVEPGPWYDSLRESLRAKKTQA